ncbi:MAG TPA: glycosyltransferase family 39 protein, partial [Stellaceae bacterium]|nr:glycosyltransferase family 39 protein [Stellaceae bacterium]
MSRRWSQGWRPHALLSLLCLALYLPGLAALPPLDRDEARFAQATRQMLESRDFLRIRFQDEARNKKPAGIYWLQAAAVAALSDARSSAIWPYRLPSLIGAGAAVLLTFALGSHLVGRAAALTGAALLAAALGVVVEAHLAKTDAVLLATVAAAQGALGI